MLVNLSVSTLSMVMMMVGLPALTRLNIRRPATSSGATAQILAELRREKVTKKGFEKICRN